MTVLSSAFFAGDVLQGTLREFVSSTTVGSTQVVSTGTINTKVKTVSVEGKFKYSARQAYNGFSSTITLGGGVTNATVLVERRYRNAADTAWEAFVTLAEETLPGSESVLNESDGPSSITWYTAGTILATDAASNRKREYRTRVVAINRRSHTVSNPGTTPALVQTQYQSIESME